MSTVRNIIAASLREIGVLSAGEEPAFDDARDAFEALNRLVDQWAGDRLQIYKITRNVLPLSTNGTGAFTVTVSDGFDTTWTASPPGWKATNPGGGADILNDNVDFQAGGHSVNLVSAAGNAPYIVREFGGLPCGRETTLTIWTHGSAANEGHVEVVGVETGHYLQPDGSWNNVVDDVFDSAGFGPFVESTLTFDLEDASVVGADTCTLRVKLYVGVLAGNTWFDTFSISTTAPGIGPSPTSPVPVGPFGFDTDRSRAIIMPRPTALNEGNVRLLDTAQTPDLETGLTMLTEEGWQALPQKDLTATRPTHWYYNPTYPFGTLNLWPVPTGSDLSVVIYAPEQVQKFTSLDDEILLPPGYERMIVKNLAIELCPTYSRQPHPALVKNAQESLAGVKRSNLRLYVMSFDPGALVGSNRLGRFSIFSGQ